MSHPSRFRWMIYKLHFTALSEKEWRKLDSGIRELFKKRLAERLKQPRIESSRLHDLQDCYKIKLRHVGYRLVYQVLDDLIVVKVVAVGKRDKNAVYLAAQARLHH